MTTTSPYRKTTPADVQALDDPNADPNQIWASIAHITFDELYEHEAAIRRLVLHENDLVRDKAISRLLWMWVRLDLVDQALYMALHDPSEFVRRGISSTLSILAERRKAEDPDLVHRVLVMLVAQLWRGPEGVFATAYDGIAKLVDVGNYQEPRFFDRDKHVNWKALEQYREEALSLDFVPTVR